MQIGDFIEDTYRSFNGEIVAVVRGVIMEISEDRNIKVIKYHCSQIHYSDSFAHQGMLGKMVQRNARNVIVLSEHGGKVGQSGV